MTGDENVLAAIDDAFGSIPRPEHFTNFEHCCECAEHDAALLAVDPLDIDHDAVGSAAWDPVTFATPGAFAYLLPGLARLALGAPHSQWGWYGEQLLAQLTRDGRDNERVLAMTAKQRAAVCSLLDHLLETRAELVADYGLEADLLTVFDYYSGTASAKDL